jgi:metal-responsive CopG/Arc/MetJ family transcriptional regulator
MTRKRKVAVTVSPEALAAAERLRKRTGESRSAVFERALQRLVEDERRAEQSRRYVAGYRAVPERAAEINAALAIGLVALATEPWDAKG